MQKRKPEFLIPILYLVIIIFMNILVIALQEIIDISDPIQKDIRIGSIVNLGFYGSLFVLYIVLFIPAWKKTFADFRARKQTLLAIIAVGLFTMFSSMFIVGFLYTMIGVTSTPDNQIYLEAQLNGPLFDKVTLVLFAVIFAPVVEESLFRLAGFRLFKKIHNIPIWAVILITSLFFGAIHVLGDNPIQIIYYAALGIILGVIYHKSNNIIAPIVVHMLFNGFVTLTMFIGL